MKTVLTIILTVGLFISHAQTAGDTAFERKGFVFGAAPGASYLQLSTQGVSNQSILTASFPNFKLGAMLTKRSAILISLPGSIYTYKDSGRNRDRGFEGIIPGIQYWVKDKWWVLCGVGLAMDAPAFYDIKDESERKFYFGTGMLAGTGYELWKKKKIALDIQARAHYGTMQVNMGKQNGLAVNVLIGLNWY